MFRKIRNIRNLSDFKSSSILIVMSKTDVQNGLHFFIQILRIVSCSMELFLFKHLIQLHENCRTVQKILQTTNTYGGQTFRVHSFHVSNHTERKLKLKVYIQICRFTRERIFYVASHFNAKNTHHSYNIALY